VYWGNIPPISNVYVLEPKDTLRTLSEDEITAVIMYVAMFENCKFPVVWLMDTIFEFVPEGILKFVLKFNGVFVPTV
jgi:hypothetical protein